MKLSCFKRILNLFSPFVVKKVFFLFLLQQRARENREARKRMISDEYKFIMGIVGSYIDLEVSAVEEFIVDSEEVWKI